MFGRATPIVSASHTGDKRMSVGKFMPADGTTAAHCLQTAADRPRSDRVQIDLLLYLLRHVVRATWLATPARSCGSRHCRRPNWRRAVIHQGTFSERG